MIEVCNQAITTEIVLRDEYESNGFDELSFARTRMAHELDEL